MGQTGKRLALKALGHAKVHDMLSVSKAHIVAHQGVIEDLRDMLPDLAFWMNDPIRTQLGQDAMMTFGRGSLSQHSFSGSNMFLTRLNTYAKLQSLSRSFEMCTKRNTLQNEFRTGAAQSHRCGRYRRMPVQDHRGRRSSSCKEIAYAVFQTSPCRSCTVFFIPLRANGVSGDRL